MKLTAIFLLLFTLNVSAKERGQKKITINMSNAEISNILSAIEKKSGYRFLYNNDLTALKQKTSLSVADAEISQVLQTLFQNTSLSYQFMDNNLIVIKGEGQVYGSPESVQAVVTGTVTGENGSAMAGVSVQVKGTSRGTTTNNEGKFSINAESDDVLVISYVGFETQEIRVGSQTQINVSLKDANATLTDVVVIGYGTANKRDLTGSIARVAGKDIADKPNPNPVASLQGKVAGVSVVNSGTPGAQPDIRIRGTISIGSVRPVYVVDGILNDNIDFINPNDIESIEILKDPSSLAIFGVRGAAGAIVITTKKAKAGQMLVNFNSTYGTKRLVDKIKLTNAEEFKLLYNEQLQNQGDVPFDFSDWNGNTDWIEALSQKGVFNTNNISVTASSEKNRFYMNAGYINDQGMVRHERLKKILLTLSDEYKVSKAFKVGFNVNGIWQDIPYLTPTNSYSNLLTDARRVSPVASTATINGVYSILPGFQSAQITNPLMLLESTYDKNFQKEFRTVASVFAEVNFLKSFTFRATGYGDITNGNKTSYSPILRYYLPTLNDSITINPNYNLTSLNIGDYRTYKWQQDNILTYRKDFGDHGLTLTGGTTIYYESQYTLTATGKQSSTGDPIPNEKRMWYINNALVDQSTVRASSTQFERTTASWLARMLYNYKGKYLLNASFRNDGTSGFKNNPRQNFWAVGAAWELTKENFMQSQHFFDFLKLKASMGVLGNQSTTYNDGTSNPYPSYAPLQASSAVFGNTIYPAYAASYVPDENLRWETVHAKEIGVEFTALKNRLHVEAAYYNKLTKDLLAIQPGLLGFPARLSNIGSISNKGLEFTAGWTQQISNDFSFSVNTNLTTFKNNVVSLYSNDPDGITGANEQYPNRTAVGRPIGFFFGYIVEGVYQNQAEVDNSPTVNGFGEYGPGDLKFKDISGPDGKPDGIIDSKDRTMIGNPTPNFTYGASVTLNYKGFDLGIDLQGVAGNEIYRYWGTSELTFAPFNYPQWKMNRWHGEGTSNWVPQVNNNHNINSKGLSTFGIESGSYVRIRNVQLGYNFDRAMLQKAHIKSLRIFISAQNLKTFKKNYGYTPDFGGNATSFGIDNGNGPVPAIYTAGINVTF